MLTEQLLDSPSHFLRGFGVYCRDNGIPESEVLLGLQKAAAAFPRVQLELRKTALDPKSAKSGVGLVSGLASRAVKGVKSLFGYGDEITAAAAKGPQPVTNAATPLVAGSRVTGGVLGGVAPSGPPNNVATVNVNPSTAVPQQLQTRVGNTQAPVGTPTVFPSNSAGNGMPRSRAGSGSPRFNSAPAQPAPNPAQPAPAAAKPAAAATGAVEDAAASAGASPKGPADVSDEAYTAAFDEANAVKTRSLYQATKDGLGQARDIAIGGTAGQRALTAGSAAAGATYGGVNAAMDPDADWRDVAGGAAQYGLAGAALPAVVRGYATGNVAKALAATSLASAAGYGGAKLDDTIAGERGMYGTGDFDAVNTQATLDARGNKAHALLASRQSADPAVNAANENELLSRQLEANTRINGDPRNIDRTFDDYAPKYTGRLDDREKLNEFLQVGGEAAQVKLRGNADNLERQLVMSKQSGKEIDPKMLNEYVTVQEAIASNASGGKPGDVAAKVEKELKHGITEEGVGNSLKTDAGKDAFKEYSKQFFGPDGPTADPSTILSNFVEIMKTKPYQAAALMLGIPVAMFGVMSALGGEGGMGAVLATVLGGGAAAYGAGMLGGPEQGGGMKLFGAGPAGPAATAKQPTAVPVGQRQLSQLEFAQAPGGAAHAALLASAGDRSSPDYRNAKTLTALAPTQQEFAAGVANAGDAKKLTAWITAQKAKYGLNSQNGWIAPDYMLAAEMIKAMNEPADGQFAPVTPVTPAAAPTASIGG